VVLTFAGGAADLNLGLTDHSRYRRRLDMDARPKIFGRNNTPELKR